MITSFFIYLASQIINLILTPFPVSTGLPTEFHTALTTLTGYVGILDPLVPISTLVSALTIVFVYEFTIFSFKALSWIYHKIPVIGK